ncbi:hypothetical protein PPERSA_01398 [Pseudocohnilembus persalinus]|uniref:Uncharacterized protein n=1 Tax=Pseudocohnilembus persalinus TaxID=266149 RepID=A0A0V0QH27_PSEPJ|nr:hypothetical protein PPERSA_01398 [Pseudocohnilembus persalinus]|eukprot:KRX01495.1 hypothetical protein PPERSA_01398 [Pseudocohnilembus persalinus]
MNALLQPQDNSYFVQKQKNPECYIFLSEQAMEKVRELKDCRQRFGQTNDQQFQQIHDIFNKFINSSLNQQSSCMLKDNSFFKFLIQNKQSQLIQINNFQEKSIFQKGFQNNEKSIKEFLSSCVCLWSDETFIQFVLKQNDKNMIENLIESIPKLIDLDKIQNNNNNDIDEDQDEHIFENYVLESKILENYTRILIALKFMLHKKLDYLENSKIIMLFLNSFNNYISIFGMGLFKYYQNLDNLLKVVDKNYNDKFSPEKQENTDLDKNIKAVYELVEKYFKQYYDWSDVEIVNQEQVLNQILIYQNKFISNKNSQLCNVFNLLNMMIDFFRNIQISIKINELGEKYFQEKLEIQIFFDKKQLKKLQIQENKEKNTIYLEISQNTELVQFGDCQFQGFEKVDTYM